MCARVGVAQLRQRPTAAATKGVGVDGGGEAGLSADLCMCRFDDPRFMDASLEARKAGNELATKAGLRNALMYAIGNTMLTHGVHYFEIST